MSQSATAPEATHPKSLAVKRFADRTVLTLRPALGNKVPAWRREPTAKLAGKRPRRCSSFIIHEPLRRRHYALSPSFCRFQHGLSPFSRPIFFAKQNAFAGRRGDGIVRVGVSLVVVAFAAAVSLSEASAQTYSSSPVDRAPVPPLDVGAPPPHNQGYSAQSTPALAQRIAAQAPTSVRNDSVPRPPADIGGGPASADVTGSIRTPDAATMPAPDRATVIAALPPEEQPEAGPAKELPPQYRRQLVDYPTSEPAGTVIIDTPHTYLYLVRGGGKALRYGIGVGREGFTWSGTQTVTKKAEWPDWTPPSEMIERQPYLPRFMAGGPTNPLGARAMYLGGTVYRIHGTNAPSTIGSRVSSGCIRLVNEDVIDLYSRVNVGTKVIVLPIEHHADSTHGTRG